MALRYSWLWAPVVAVALGGCAAFLAENGDLISPSGGIGRPHAAELPAARSYVETAAEFRREVRVGLGGAVEATLVDPRLAGAELAHDAMLQGLKGAALESLILNRWSELYGAQSDRFPIDVAWRFDQQFIAANRVLEPSEWSFRLDTRDGRSYAPLAVSVLKREQAPQAGYWEGAVRLSFPWRDPASNQLLVGGANTGLTLSLRHRSGEGAVSWRFRSVYEGRRPEGTSF